MAWNDTPVCSFCGKEIPIHRRLSKAQFCSKAHEESFLQQQTQMAVETLHRTHDALKAYRPSGASIEDILGSPAVLAATPWTSVAVAEPVVDPEIQEPEEAPEWYQAVIEQPDELVFEDSNEPAVEVPEEAMDHSVFHFGDSQARLQEYGFLSSLRRLWESLTSRRD